MDRTFLYSRTDGGGFFSRAATFPCGWLAGVQNGAFGLGAPSPLPGDLFSYEIENIRSSFGGYAWLRECERAFACVDLLVAWRPLTGVVGVRLGPCGQGGAGTVEERTSCRTGCGGRFLLEEGGCCGCS